MPEIPEEAARAAVDAMNEVLATGKEFAFGPDPGDRLARAVLGAAAPILAAHIAARLEDAARIARETFPPEPIQKEEPKAEPDEPACEWFAWIGQSFRSCDRCGRPAWDHKGEETFADEWGPFDERPPVGKPWAPGEADAIRAKWEVPRAG